MADELGLELRLAEPADDREELEHVLPAHPPRAEITVVVSVDGRRDRPRRLGGEPAGVSASTAVAGGSGSQIEPEAVEPAETVGQRPSVAGSVGELEPLNDLVGGEDEPR